MPCKDRHDGNIESRNTEITEKGQSLGIRWGRAGFKHTAGIGDTKGVSQWGH